MLIGLFEFTMGATVAHEARNKLDNIILNTNFP
jgi:hypothetical protein